MAAISSCRQNDVQGQPISKLASSYFKDYISCELQRLKKIQRRNIQILCQQPLREISGAFGDLGTLMPLFLGLAQNDSISVSSTLVFMGLSNILTGVYFGIPLPVQPMKAIAAVAIAGRYTQPQLASAGLFSAAIVGFLSISGLVRWFTRWIPLPIVKGIQVGTGISLMISAGGYLPLSLSSHSSAYLALTATLLFLLFCSVFRKIPFVLVLVLLCIPMVFFVYDYEPHLSIWKPVLTIPSPADFGFGAINAGLGQIPLTTLNSIIAVTFLAVDLVPDAPEPSATAIGSSVAVMNLVGCWFSAMPLCHGSGGLASQYRFGARSGTSIIFLGIVKLLLGLFASEYAIQYCRVFSPVPLGVLLFTAGLELAKMGESLNTEAARDLWEKTEPALAEHDAFESTARTARKLTEKERMRRWVVMLATVGSILAAKNDGVGFVVGLVLHGAYKMIDRIEDTRHQSEGYTRLENQEPGQDTQP